MYRSDRSKHLQKYCRAKTKANFLTTMHDIFIGPAIQIEQGKDCMQATNHRQYVMLNYTLGQFWLRDSVLTSDSNILSQTRKAAWRHEESTSSQEVRCLAPQDHHHDQQQPKNWQAKEFRNYQLSSDESMNAHISLILWNHTKWNSKENHTKVLRDVA